LGCCPLPLGFAHRAAAHQHSVARDEQRAPEQPRLGQDERHELVVAVAFGVAAELLEGGRAERRYRPDAARATGDVTQFGLAQTVRKEVTFLADDTSFRKPCTGLATGAST
jgi:hypothetical protein